MLKKGVFADFDGTLSSGYLSMAFLEELIEQKLFHKSNYNNQKIIIEGLNKFDKFDSFLIYKYKHIYNNEY